MLSAAVTHLHPQTALGCISAKHWVCVRFGLPFASGTLCKVFASRLVWLDASVRVVWCSMRLHGVACG